MSVDESTSSIMEGIRHGACHYLIKPVHEDDMRNIWQHIVRKTRNQNKEHEDCGGLLEVNDPNKANDDPEYISSDIDANEGIVKDRKKRSLSREGDGVDDNPSTPKKQRFVWTPERHQIFVDAVLQLGIDSMILHQCSFFPSWCCNIYKAYSNKYAVLVFQVFLTISFTRVFAFFFFQRLCQREFLH